MKKNLAEKLKNLAERKAEQLEKEAAMNKTQINEIHDRLDQANEPDLSQDGSSN